MEFQSGLALIIVQRGWLNCSRYVDGFNAFFFDKDNSLIILL